MRRGLLNSNATSSIDHTYNNHSILHRYGYPPRPHSLSMLSRPHPTMLGDVSQTAHYALELAAATPTPPYQSRRLNADDLMAMRLSTTHDDFGTHGVAPLLGRNNNNPSFIVLHTNFICDRSSLPKLLSFLLLSLLKCQGRGGYENKQSDGQIDREE